VEAHPWAAVRDNLGTRKYFSLMRHAAAMVGNSSSGIIEAPSLGLPVVNIGARQAGRTRAANVIDVGGGRTEIAAGIARATEPGFRAGLAGRPNPYGDGGAAARVVEALKRVALGPTLTAKRFLDQPGTEERP
jgi:UDP-N-acetylglucosamine 2-epimerase